MTIQAQVSVQSEVYTFRPRDYDVFAGLDVDNHSIAATFTDHDRLMRAARAFPEIKLLRTVPGWVPSVLVASVLKFTRPAASARSASCGSTAG